MLKFKELQKLKSNPNILFERRKRDKNSLLNHIIREKCFITNNEVFYFEIDIYTPLKIL